MKFKLLSLFISVFMFGCTSSSDYSPKNITTEYNFPHDMDCSVIKVYSKGDSSEPTLFVIKCGKDKTLNYTKQEGKVRKNYVIVDDEKYTKEKDN